MSSSEYLIRDCEVRPISIRLEKHKGGQDVLEYVDHVVARVLVLPRPAGKIRSVALALGRKLVRYRVEDVPLSPEDGLHLLTCYQDDASLVINPAPPFPDACVVVEHDDG